MTNNQLSEPFVFDDDTVNGENYFSMLESFFLSDVRRLYKVRSITFQQDGVPPHFARDVRQFLDKHFPDRWIGRSGPIRLASP